MIINDNCEVSNIVPLYQRRAEGILRIHDACDIDECPRKRRATEFLDEIRALERVST
jgi:hypothetical protein